MTMAHNQVGPCIELERSLPSEVAAISPFVDRLMLLFRKCGCVSEGESGVEIALREALANAITHGNFADAALLTSPLPSKSANSLRAREAVRRAFMMRFSRP